MLAHLKYFYQAAISENFTQAAEKLHITQPALSRQIAALENELDLQLFNRQGRKPALTDAGRRLFHYADEIIKLCHEAEKEMHELNNLNAGNLNIGASVTIANYILPPVLADYNKQHPMITLAVTIASSEEIEQSVLENKVDFGLTGSIIQNANLYQEPLLDDELNLVVASNHHLAEQSMTVTPAQLEEETFLLREEGSDSRKHFEILMEQCNIKPSKMIVLKHTESIKNGIIHNLGVSFLSKVAWQNEKKLGLLVPLRGYNANRSFKLIYRKNSRLSPAALMFTALLNKHRDNYSA